jgi:CheY-like chemotaxis protein
MQENAVILVAEDDASDALLLKLAFRRSNNTADLHFVQNGEEVIAYLLGDHPFEDRARFPLPEVLLLDLKMPRVDGYDVLEWLGHHREFKSMSVGVLSGMEGTANIQRAFELGADFYLIKPHNPAELAGLAAQIAERQTRVSAGVSSDMMLH